MAVRPMMPFLQRVGDSYRVAPYCDTDAGGTH